MGQSLFKKSKISLLCLGLGACLPLNGLFPLSSAEASSPQAVGTGAISQQYSNSRQPVRYAQNSHYQQRQPARRQAISPGQNHHVQRRPVQNLPVTTRQGVTPQNVAPQGRAQSIPLDSVYRQAYNRAAASGYNSKEADQYARQVVAAYQRRSAVPSHSVHVQSEQMRVHRQQELAKMQANAALWNRIERQRRQAWENAAGYRQGVAQTNRQMQQANQQMRQAYVQNRPAPSQANYQQPNRQQVTQVQQPPAQVDYSRTFPTQNAVANTSQNVRQQAGAAQAVAQNNQVQPGGTRPVSVMETAPPSAYVPAGSSTLAAPEGTQNSLTQNQHVQGNQGVAPAKAPAVLSQPVLSQQPAPLATAPAKLPLAMPGVQLTGPSKQTGRSTQPAPLTQGKAAANTPDLLSAPVISVENPTATSPSAKKGVGVPPVQQTSASQKPAGHIPKPLPGLKTTTPAKSKESKGFDNMELKLEGHIGKARQPSRHYVSQQNVSQVTYQQEGMAPSLTGKLQPAPNLNQNQLPSTTIQAPPTLQAPIGLTGPNQGNGLNQKPLKSAGNSPNGQLPASNQSLSTAPPTNFGDLNPPTQSTNPNRQWSGQSTGRPLTKPAIAVKSPRGVRLQAASARANQPYRLQENQQPSTPALGNPNQLPQQDPVPGTTLASCNTLRERMKSQSLQSFNLDLHSPLAEAKRRTTGQRTWKDRDGKTIVVGRAVSGGSMIINVDEGEGLIRPIELAMLSDVDRQYALSLIDLPAECGLSSEAVAARSFVPSTVTWYASNLCHKPLYFEDIQLERYGHTKGPIRQPVRSAASFLIRTALLPYQMAMHPPNECQYPLGLYRPGNCAPYLRTPFPWNRRAVLRQATAVGVGIGSIP